MTSRENDPFSARSVIICMRFKKNYFGVGFLCFSFMISLSFVFYSAVPCAQSLGMENRLIKDAQITASSEYDSKHSAIQAR